MSNDTKARVADYEEYPVRLYALAHPDGTRLYLTVDEWKADAIRYLDDVWKVVPLYAYSEVETIERLERDRDALAERCERLRKALRMVVIGYGEFIGDEHTLEVCDLCEHEWRRGEPERHTPGCLAAPKDAP